MPVRRASWGEAQAWIRWVALTPTDECAIWPFKSVAGQTPRPVTGSGPQRPVTHVVLEVLGVTIPEDSQVNHTCDQTFCCNPRHLYVGTQGENIRDAVRRGRMNGLTEEVIAQVSALSETMGYKRIAKTLNIPFYAARYHGRKARRAVI